MKQGCTKVKKIRNATKTPNLQIPQKLDNQKCEFGEILCFRVLVAKKLFGQLRSI